MSLVDSRFTAADGVGLAWHETGQGRPLVLLHGYLSDARMNWVKHGHADALAAAGFRVIMPDLRGHGDSDRPHDRSCYPPDVLADDGLALVEHLELREYDLGGYSLGGRTVARMLARGAMPRRAIIAGMGLAGLTDTGARVAHFRKLFGGLGRHEQGSALWFAEAFMKTNEGDPIALAHVLETAVDTPVAALAAIATPVLVLSGVDDEDNGSAPALAELLLNATLAMVPGNHMSAVAKPNLSAAMIDYLNR